MIDADLFRKKMMNKQRKKIRLQFWNMVFFIIS